MDISGLKAPVFMALLIERHALLNTFTFLPLQKEYIQ
jgi:hypothetical protein